MTPLLLPAHSRQGGEGSVFDSKVVCLSAQQLHWTSLQSVDENVQEQLECVTTAAAYWAVRSLPQNCTGLCQVSACGAGVWDLVHLWVGLYQQLFWCACVAQSEQEKDVWERHRAGTPHELGKRGAELPFSSRSSTPASLYLTVVFSLSMKWFLLLTRVPPNTSASCTCNHTFNWINSSAFNWVNGDY